MRNLHLFKKLLATGCLAGCLWLGAMPGRASLASNFRQPPPEARPWVYWFWLNGNISSNGITADLEAMQQAGIGGVLIMEVNQGAPVGPVDFMSPRWRNLFKHVHTEARRLGLAVNMNNDAGWNGSGGPWIKPEQAMQEIVWSETSVDGPTSFAGQLPEPAQRNGYYRDVAVLAFPATGDYRIPNIETKGSFQNRGLHQPSKGDYDPAKVIEPETMENLAGKMDAHGKLTWQAPPGRWTVLRIGHTCTGSENAPAPATGQGLECDKLSADGIQANFSNLMQKLAADNRLQPGNARSGLVATHIDSWENGAQNWTPQMREEFAKRRGYDLTPYLPVLTGRVVESLEVSERFLWDLRQTISELVIDRYAGQMHRLANAAGLRFTVEAYGGPCDAIPYAGRSDEPMGEFWTPDNTSIETCRGMASAGHVYGKRIIGAEAFTSGEQERWLEHPATLKPHGDLAFCEGINRFVFHRYALQPWAEERVPGMTMGPWGQHYERTQTWWAWTPAWHEYLARCQYLLRQGLFVADICYVQPEAPPQGLGDHPREGYNWDECTAEAVLTRMTCKNGLLTLPDGMSYRLLVLPPSKTMTPGLLRKAQDLVAAGATVLGPKPTTSPSLSGFPDCDDEVQRLAAQLWGQRDAQTEHRFGKGRVIRSGTPEKLLSAANLPPDFSSSQPLRFIHRRADQTDIYFVANLQPWEFSAVCGFRVTGKTPELWWPHNGRIERAAVWEETAGVTRVAIPFDPCGSVFVVFQEPTLKAGALQSVKRNGKEILSAKLQPPARIVIHQARYGVLNDPGSTRDAREQVRQKVDSGEVSFPVNTLAETGDPAPMTIKTLAVDYEIEGRLFHVEGPDTSSIELSREAVRAEVEKARYGVLDDPQRTRDVRAKIQTLLDAGHTHFKVATMADGDDPAFLVVKTLEVDYVLDGQRHHLTGQDPDKVYFSPQAKPEKPVAAVNLDARGRTVLAVTEPGEYEWAETSGKTDHARISAIPQPYELTGPWRVRFQARRGAPSEAVFDNLISWSRHPDPGIRYFSGEATYQKDFMLPEEMRAQDLRVWLDLGNVQVVAEVQLNGKTIATLWKPPYEADLTGRVKPGKNQLRIRTANLWPNRMLGDECLPEDSERRAEGTLKQWPSWLLAGKPSPTGRFTFTSWRLWKKEEPLLESGLLGPVKIRAAKTLNLQTR